MILISNPSPTQDLTFAVDSTPTGDSTPTRDPVTS